MKPDILIFTRPIRTGKTTELFLWQEGRSGIAGILTPDKDGRRMVYDLAAKAWFPLETDDDGSENIVRVGRFCFDAQGFEKAREILMTGAREDREYLVIDEVGKLELEAQGLEPAAGQIIELYKKGRQKGKLILIIRDSLLEKAIDHYSLTGARVINSLNCVDDK